MLDGTLCPKGWLYPTNKTPFTYTTSKSAPGKGLEAGALSPGGTYTVLLSELLLAAGAPLDFNGYLFVITNFSKVCGAGFVSNFDGFTLGVDFKLLDKRMEGH